MPTTLFCKPYTYTTLFQQETNSGTLGFRSLVLEQDLSTIHRWMNEPYALPYWQMGGSEGYVKGIYQSILNNPQGHSFIGLLDHQPICLIDAYLVEADELKHHVALQDHDCGIHLLMAPNEKPIPGLTATVFQSFLRYLFSFDQCQRVYAEPDVHNSRSIHLLRCAGFDYLKTIALSYKTAFLYCLERSAAESFLKADNSGHSPSLTSPN